MNNPEITWEEVIVYVPENWDFVVCRELQVWLVTDSVDERRELHFSGEAKGGGSKRWEKNREAVLSQSQMGIWKQDKALVGQSGEIHACGWMHSSLEYVFLILSFHHSIYNAIPVTRASLSPAHLVTSVSHHPSLSVSQTPIWIFSASAEAWLYEVPFLFFK